MGASEGSRRHNPVTHTGRTGRVAVLPAVIGPSQPCSDRGANVGPYSHPSPIRISREVWRTAPYARFRLDDCWQRRCRSLDNLKRGVPPADACTLAGKDRTARVCLEPGKLT